MKLIVLAHYGEAQIIIDEYSLSKKSEELYQNDEFGLLLTGEGPFEACARVSRELSRGIYNEVINLGIAGSLEADLKINDIYPVRTIYLVIDGKLQYKSFELARTGLDLLTSFERILDPAKAHKLTGMGKMVDREAWGVAFACKEHGVPLRSYKLISDAAGTLGACEIVKNDAEVFSLKLCEKLKEILSVTPHQVNEESIQLDQNFYFTFSLKHKFLNLVEKILLRDQIELPELLAKLPINALKEEKLTPKQRAKALVDELEILLDPFKGELQKALKNWKDDYKGIDITTDPSWESPEVKFSFVARSDEELKSKIAILNSLEFRSYYNILEGKIHVE